MTAMAIRTLDDLDAALTVDYKWRSTEMFLWERLTGRSRELERSALLRGGLALVYAHWEGYIKTAGASYLEFVSRKGLTVGQLRPEIAAVAIRSRIAQLAAEKSPERHTEIVELIRGEANVSARVPYDSTTIRTNANLNFATFESIMHSLGCSAHAHSAARAHIDLRLLSCRNEIAHGRAQFVDLEEWIECRDVVERIMKDVRNQLSNSAATHAYLR
ncbi:MAG: hypothetical protein HGA44_17850 [Cellulomonadaceae bacterium]|nr:hypothetical protein [Cellulomonadaceae bacterium]